VLFVIAFLVMTIGSFGLVRHVFANHTVVQPAFGGRVTEGVVGTPRFVNPVLADSRVDRDLVRLTYSGLMRLDDAGDLVPDLAQSFTVSEDEKTYTFTLRDDIRFHDGNRISAGDIAFTIGLTQISTLQSPLRDTWTDIVVSVLDNQTISFTLPQPFAGFLNQTTLGVLPSHIWQGLPIEQIAFSEYNAYPVIGSGPFEIVDLNRNRAGVPTSYQLRPNRAFWLGSPHVRRLDVAFYPTEAALLRAFSSGAIDTMSAISPKLVADTPYRLLVSTTLPRVFGLFFNTNRQPLLADEAIIEALDQAIDKTALVDAVLGGFGEPLAGPLPPPLTTLSADDSFNPAAAEVLLSEAGWQLREPAATVRTNAEGEALQFAIATSDVPELKQTAEIIKRDLADIGILVTINVFEIGKLESDIIQPRNFEALLFGQVIRHDTDSYAFWHSSQAGAEGLNITNYANDNVDEALEAALATREEGLRTNLYRTVEEEIIADRPGIFLYAPDFVYMTNSDIGNFDIGTIAEPSDRLWNTPAWYVATERIWKFFHTASH
jgi:peptide/nickel transport system substrate-binding protein